MLLNLDTVPVWTVALAQILALGLLGVTGWFVGKPEFRRRIPPLLAVVSVLTLAETRIQERSWRVAAWIIVVVSLTFALSALGRRGRLYADYKVIEQKYGKKSKELNSYAMKAAARIAIIMIALMVLSAVFIKGAYSQGR